MYHMTGNLGRVRRNSILMCTGNGQVRRIWLKYICFTLYQKIIGVYLQGAVGFTVSAGKYGQNQKALRKAVNKAGLRMVYVDR